MKVLKYSKYKGNRRDIEMGDIEELNYDGKTLKLGVDSYG